MRCHGWIAQSWGITATSTLTSTSARKRTRKADSRRAPPPVTSSGSMAPAPQPTLPAGQIRCVFCRAHFVQWTHLNTFANLCILIHCVNTLTLVLYFFWTENWPFFGWLDRNIGLNLFTGTNVENKAYVWPHLLCSWSFPNSNKPFFPPQYFNC